MSKEDVRPSGLESGDADQGSRLLETNRRKFMAAGAASWISVSLAGCLGSDDDDDEGDGLPNYVVTDDVVAGSDGIPEGAGGLISAGRPQRAFVPGMEAIFKVGIWEPETGDIVDDDTIDEADVVLDTDTTVPLEFVSTNREWSGGWSIPADIDTGTVGYEVEVTNDGEFTGVGVTQSQLEIIDFDPQVANFVVTDDTYSTDTRGGGWVQSCLPAHNFTPDMAIGFDIGIYDGGSGEPVGPDTVDEVVIDFETGDEMELAWDEDGEYWNETWRGTPDDYEGTLEYEVLVTNEGEYHHVGVHQGSVNIIEDPGDGEDPTDHYVVTDDTYSTETRGGGWVQSCLPAHNFTPDMAVGFDIGIYDARTGDPVGPDVVDEAVLEFEAGDPDEVDLEWDEDGEYWNYTWRGIPEGYEGTLEYEVLVSNDGEFHRVGVYQDSINVIAEP